MTTAQIASSTAATTETVAVPKAPSKKSQALVIFQTKMLERSQGLYKTNKEFRKAVLEAIVTVLSVSVASAATMYNAAKKDAMAADATVALGRDPKKERVKSATGKRGRPAGSKNKEKAADSVAADAAPVAEAGKTAEEATV